MSENKESAAKEEVKAVKTHYDLKKEQREKNKKREQRELMLWKIAGAVIILAIVAFIAYFPVKKYMTMNETVCTIGGRDISRIEYDYNYNMVKNAYLNSYGSYLSMYGMDLNNIESQYYDQVLTFGDYFQKETVERIKQTVALSEEIKAEGYTCDVSEDYDRYLENMRTGAEASQMSLGDYYKDSLGEYATERRVEKYVKEALVISEFTDHKQNSFEPSDDEISARYTEDAGDYDLFDYRITKVDAVLPTEPTELADEGATVPEGGVYTPSQAEIDAAMAEAKTAADAAEKTVNTSGELHEGEKSSQAVYQIRNWLTDPSRVKGDTTVIEAEYSNCYYAVGYIGRYMDEKTTYNIRMIVSEEADGATIYGEYVANGSTEDAFADLVPKYSMADNGNGGLYEGIEGTELSDGLNKWITDPARVYGDVTTYVDEENSQTYVVYFVGGGKPSWYYTIRNLIRSESMDAYLSGLTATVTVDDPKGNLKYIALEEAAAFLEEAQGVTTGE